MSTKETYKICNCLKSEGELSVQLEVASIELDEMDAGHQIIHQCEDSYSWTTWCRETTQVMTEVMYNFFFFIIYVCLCFYTFGEFSYIKPGIKTNDSNELYKPVPDNTLLRKKEKVAFGELEVFPLIIETLR